MPLAQDILADIKTAMKASDQTTLTVLRGLNASIKNKAIEKSLKAGAETPLTEDETLAVVMTEAKKRRDSIAAFTEAGRAELAKQEESELVVLQKYLPKQLSRAEVEAAIEKIASSTGLKEFGPLMKAVMTELRGKADGQMITEIIKKRLG